MRAGRLARSHLAQRAPAERLVEVVRDICGIHAQVMGSAELQLAVRVEGITQADVREALWERRTIAKTWTTRDTLHIHPADELSLWTAARRAVAEPGRIELVTRDRRRAARRAADPRAACGRRRRASRPRRRATSSCPVGASTSATRRLPECSASVHQRARGSTFVHVDDWLGPQRAVGDRSRHYRRSPAATRPPTRPSACGNCASGSLPRSTSTCRTWRLRPAPAAPSACCRSTTPT